MTWPDAYEISYELLGFPLPHFRPSPVSIMDCDSATDRRNMIPLRILVLDSQSFQLSVVVTALERLGMTDIFQARTDKDAMTLIRLQGGVDIAICDVTHQTMDYLAFLRRASQSGRVRALILYGELDPASYRALEQMAALSGLELLGRLSKPLLLRSLQKKLRLYSRRFSEYPTAKKSIGLPSEEDVRRGLALGEFRAYFQPKCVVASGDMIGAEVLARWQHPTKGLLLPKDFLAAVLAYDLIDELFKQLFEQGLRLQSFMRQQNQRLELSFNLHASQLKHDGLIPYIQQRVSHHELVGSHLTFELAENGLLGMGDLMTAELTRLRTMGCGLAIDDFGVGFSSLKLLCLLPFTQIKLDGEFVQSLHLPHSKTLISSTQALAAALNMELVMEGVSNQCEHLALLEMGCLYGQGFYYARPMTVQALVEWLKAQKRRH